MSKISLKNILKRTFKKKTKKKVKKITTPKVAKKIKRPVKKIDKPDRFENLLDFSIIFRIEANSSFGFILLIVKYFVLQS